MGRLRTGTKSLSLGDGVMHAARAGDHTISEKSSHATLLLLIPYKQSMHGYNIPASHASFDAHVAPAVTICGM